MTSLVKYALAALVLAAPAVAMAQSTLNTAERSDRHVEIGKLTCNALPETRRNYIVRSTAQIDCKYKPVKGESEHYVGVTGMQLGIDLSIREKDTLRFAVFDSRKADDERLANPLTGKYFGATATATITYGLGAAALVGGTRKNLALVPVSIETIRGLGVSAGVGYLYLEPAA